jgi:hypothetical protein
LWHRRVHVYVDAPVDRGTLRIAYVYVYMYATLINYVARAMLVQRGQGSLKAFTGIGTWKACLHILALCRPTQVRMNHDVTSQVLGVRTNHEVMSYEGHGSHCTLTYSHTVLGPGLVPSNCAVISNESWSKLRHCEAEHQRQTSTSE